MELPHEIKVGVPLMRDDVERALARLEIDPATCEPAVIFREACKVAVDHWMITQDEMRLRCAIGVLLVMLVKHDRYADKALVDEEMRALNALDAATRGVPVNFDAVLPEEEDASKWVGLVRIWQEIRGDARN